MCADEMTTGSIMATPADRATLALRSHAFNISQPKFKRIFPEYSKEKQQDLPNMGEIKRKTEESSSSQTLPATSASSGKADGADGAVAAGVGTGANASASAGKV